MRRQEPRSAHQPQQGPDSRVGPQFHILVTYLDHVPPPQKLSDYISSSLSSYQAIDRRPLPVIYYPLPAFTGRAKSPVGRSLSVVVPTAACCAAHSPGSVPLGEAAPKTLLKA